jgi:hypothetical protein
MKARLKTNSLMSGLRGIDGSHPDDGQRSLRATQAKSSAAELVSDAWQHLPDDPLQFVPPPSARGPATMSSSPSKSNGADQ